MGERDNAKRVGPARDVQRSEVVEALRVAKDTLRRQWVEAMASKGFLADMTEEETETESHVIYNTVLECIETRDYGGVERYAQGVAERSTLRSMTPDQFLGGLLTLRDLYGRHLFTQYRDDDRQLRQALDAYEPVANRILSIVVTAYLGEREQVLSRQQDAIRELSTPVLQLRDGLLILPIIGVLDSARASQLTSGLLRAIRTHRTRVAVLDITGVPTVDSKVANHLLQTTAAAGLMGATVIVTGISPEIAKALVAIGVDLSKIRAVGDLQGGIAEADRLLGYVVQDRREQDPRPAPSDTEKT